MDRQYMILFSLLKKQLCFLIVALSLFLLCGCTPKTVVISQPHYFYSIDRSDINSEIVSLEQLLANDPDSAGEKTLFHLALLYSHHENMKPDYCKALQLLEDYISSSSVSNIDEEARYYLSLLRQMKELHIKYDALCETNQSLKKQAVVLDKDKFSLQQEKEKLEAKKRHLEEVIEKLQQLDMQIESKRN